MWYQDRISIAARRSTKFLNLEIIDRVHVARRRRYGTFANLRARLLALPRARSFFCSSLTSLGTRTEMIITSSPNTTDMFTAHEPGTGDIIVMAVLISIISSYHAQVTCTSRLVKYRGREIPLLHRLALITLAIAFYCNDVPPIAVKPPFATRGMSQESQRPRTRERSLCAPKTHRIGTQLTASVRSCL